MKSALLKMIVGPVVPNLPDVPTPYRLTSLGSQAALLRKQGSKPTEPDEADSSPITNRTGDDNPSP